MDWRHPGPRYRYVILVLAVLIVFAALGLARFGYTVLLPPMQFSMGMSHSEAGLLATANLAGYLLCCAVGGALASRYGPRAVIAAGLLGAGLAMILQGYAQTVPGAAACRALAGVGAGAANVPVMGLLASWFAQRRRGLAAGIAVSGNSLGLILVGPVSTNLMAMDGPEAWRDVWVGFGALTLALGLAAGLLLRNRPVVPAPDAPFPPAGQGDPRRLADVYRSGAVWYLGFVYAAFGFSYIIYMTFFARHLVDAGYSQAEAGRAFMLVGWFSLLCVVVWGTVSDVLGRKWTLAIVYVLHAVAFAMFALWPTRPGFTVSALLFGLSAWSIPAIVAATCGDLKGSRLAPAVLGFVTLFFGVGQALGPAVAGFLADLTGLLTVPFLVASAAAMLGAVGACFLRSHP